ncbi:hypothetical protein H2248_011831 [Termitomyces sp. 'cryptogamus']|nr:hypothetical protein H2248_011831 [Termitomyces sp. 'cryptogamus']
MDVLPAIVWLSLSLSKPISKDNIRTPRDRAIPTSGRDALFFAFLSSQLLAAMKLCATLALVVLALPCITAAVHRNSHSDYATELNSTPIGRNPVGTKPILQNRRGIVSNNAEGSTMLRRRDEPDVRARNAMSSRRQLTTTPRRHIAYTAHNRRQGTPDLTQVTNSKHRAEQQLGLPA